MGESAGKIPGDGEHRILKDEASSRPVQLDSLSAAEARLLNELWTAAGPTFDQWSSALMLSREDSLAWDLAGPSSRNPYRSVAPDVLGKSLLAREILKRKPGARFETTSRPLAAVLNGVGIECRLREGTRTSRRSGPFRRALSLMTTVVLSLLHRSGSRSRATRPPKGFLLIDSFLTASQITTLSYGDRYWTNLDGFLNPEESARLYYLPHLGGPVSRWALEGFVSGSPRKLIIKEDFLRLADYVWAVIQMMRLQPPSDIPQFMGMDVSPVVHHDLRRARTDTSLLWGLLNFRFGARLRARGLEPSLLLDWSENQDIDKGLIRGLRLEFPDLVVKGYQGYVISRRYNSNTLPTHLECDRGYCPDTLCVMGEGLVEEMEKACPYLRIAVAPAFRFANRTDTLLPRPLASSPFRPLVLLPIGLESSSEILHLLGPLIREWHAAGLLVRVRPHPLLRLDSLEELDRLQSHIIISTEPDIARDLSVSSVVIGSDSSALVQSCSLGVPAIVVGSRRTLSQNPIPTWAPPALWAEVYSTEELREEIARLAGQNPAELGKLAMELREKLFHGVSRDGVLDLLGMNPNAWDRPESETTTRP